MPYILGEDYLNPHIFCALSCGRELFELCPKALDLLANRRSKLEDKIASGSTVYGINTGFGSFIPSLICRPE